MSSVREGLGGDDPVEGPGGLGVGLPVRSTTVPRRRMVAVGTSGGWTGVTLGGCCSGFGRNGFGRKVPPERALSSSPAVVTAAPGGFDRASRPAGVTPGEPSTLRRTVPARGGTPGAEADGEAATEAGGEANGATEAEADGQPNPTAAPKPKLQPQPKPKPTAQPNPKPKLQPQPKPTAQPNPTAAPKPKLQPRPGRTADLNPAPGWTPTWAPKWSAGCAR